MTSCGDKTNYIRGRRLSWR